MTSDGTVTRNQTTIRRGWMTDVFLLHWRFWLIWLALFCAAIYWCVRGGRS